MYMITNKDRKFITEVMKNWKVVLTTGGKTLIKVKIQRSIFQGELETLIHAVRIYSQYKGMEFGIEKCAMPVTKRDKRHLTDGMQLPNQDKIRTLEERETYEYLVISEANTIKQVEMKNKIQKEYLRRTRKLLETKLSSRNLIKGINTSLVIRDTFWSGPEMNLNKLTKEQEN